MINRLEELKKYFLNNQDKGLSTNELLEIAKLSSSVANQGQLRGFISDLRKQNMFIVSKKRRGYKLSNDLVELRKYLENEINKHRAMLFVYNGGKKEIINKEIKELYKKGE